jgi:hypothetical protein
MSAQGDAPEAGATPRWTAVPATRGTDVLIYMDHSRTIVLIQEGTTVSYPQPSFLQGLTMGLKCAGSGRSLCYFCGGASRRAGQRVGNG